MQVQVNLKSSTMNRTDRIAIGELASRSGIAASALRFY